MRGSQRIFWKKKFERQRVDRTLFIYRSNDELLVAQIYVDDLVFGATFNDLDLSFANEMKIEFEMSMVGELTFFLGLQIRELKDEIFFSQSKDARELVKKFNLESSKHSRTPMSTTTELSKEASRKDVKQNLYRSMIGSLLYLTMSRLNIFFSVKSLSQVSSEPQKNTLNVC